jgi:hypothetical protein
LGNKSTSFPQEFKYKRKGGMFLARRSQIFVRSEQIDFFPAKKNSSTKMKGGMFWQDAAKYLCGLSKSTSFAQEFKYKGKAACFWQDAVKYLCGLSKSTSFPQKKNSSTKRKGGMFWQAAVKYLCGLSLTCSWFADATSPPGCRQYRTGDPGHRTRA